MIEQILFPIFSHSGPIIEQSFSSSVLMIRRGEA